MYILTVKNSCPLKLRKQQSDGYSFKLHLIPYGSSISFYRYSF